MRTSGGAFAGIIHPAPSILAIIAWMADAVKEFPVPHKLAAIARPVRGFPCESYGRCDIDAPVESVYIRSVPAGKIQVGQVWKKDDSGESYLITKVYNEAIATFALLRKTGAEAEGTVKVKVDQRGASQALPGFSYTQESDPF